MTINPIFCCHWVCGIKTSVMLPSVHHLWGGFEAPSIWAIIMGQPDKDATELESCLQLPSNHLVMETSISHRESTCSHSHPFCEQNSPSLYSCIPTHHHSFIRFGGKADNLPVNLSSVYKVLHSNHLVMETSIKHYENTCSHSHPFCEQNSPLFLVVCICIPPPPPPSTTTDLLGI